MGLDDLFILWRKSGSRRMLVGAKEIRDGLSIHTTTKTHIHIPSTSIQNIYALAHPPNQTNALKTLILPQSTC